MGLHPAVKHFFCDVPEGGILLQNAVAGIDLSFHDTATVFWMLRRINTEFQAHPDSASMLPLDPAVRYDENRNALLISVKEALRPTRRGAVFDRAKLTPRMPPFDISNERLVHVTRLEYLREFVLSDADIEAMEEDAQCTLPSIGKRALTPRELGRLVQHGPWVFDLRAKSARGTPISWGFPLLWFTRAPEFERIRQIAAAVGGSFPDHLRDRLGLVHHGKGAVLAAISFPGSALVGHDDVRPVFLDAGLHRRFMVRSSLSDDGEPRNWGQAADLLLLETPDKRVDPEFRCFDGSSERVVPPLSPGLFTHGMLTIEIVGEVAESRGVHRSTDSDFLADLQIANRTRKH